MINMRYVEIVQRKWLSQKWYAKFRADNGEVLAHTEHYHNLTDLENMLHKYFSNWPVQSPRNLTGA